ncbi:hypothetical protein BGZ60DRAFT_407019 [Tricladium varicosporioides]|nr:hypothetical protein BGZ60DRAFT_407019 [Hymenoscyphus varicosporioides]
MANNNPQSSHRATLLSDYPWVHPTSPLITSAPMRLIAQSELALAVSRAQGVGFLGLGTDVTSLSSLLEECSISLSSSSIPNTPSGILPIGVGFICWGASLPDTFSTIKSSVLKPCAAWLFAPSSLSSLVDWSDSIRKASDGKTKIWIQVGTVSFALEVAEACKPDVLIIQGSDAGGHGLVNSSSIISLLPECADALHASGFSHIPLISAGGISDGRGIAASVMLGASGVTLGTRFLASPEAVVKDGYRKAIIAANDGGVSTGRTKVYDQLRGTTGWPGNYNGRGVLNASFRDSVAGMELEENKKLYQQTEGRIESEEEWVGEKARMTTYAGTGVGLVKSVKAAGEIVGEVRREAAVLLESGGGIR